jgi:hypothetical protein
MPCLSLWDVEVSRQTSICSKSSPSWAVVDCLVARRSLGGRIGTVGMGYREVIEWDATDATARPLIANGTMVRVADGKTLVKSPSLQMRSSVGQ